MHTYNKTAPGMALWLYSVLSYISLEPGRRTYYLTTHEERRKKKENIYSSISISYFCFCFC